MLKASSQRLQYPYLIKEYTLNHIRDPIIVFKVYSLIKGYWSLWALSRVLNRATRVLSITFAIWVLGSRNVEF